MEAQQPSVAPFTYLLIPADQTKAVSSLNFTGPSDDALRASITHYFHRTKLTVGQREEMKASIVEKAHARSAPQPGATAFDNEDAGGAAPSADAATTTTKIPSLAEGFVDHASFEIVPVVMPTRRTGFVGTSLYIDDAGRFKELPLNPRASAIAQKDIRGDAFLLSNYDDPALDEWKRVDCTEAHFQELLAHPPSSTLDTSDQGAMSRATMMRDGDARKISVEDAERALQARKDGNAFFAQGDIKAAVQAYSETIDLLLSGRRDLHPNADDLEHAVRAAVLNRSLCYGKLGNWTEAAKDAQCAADMDPGNGKAYFRLATARAALKEFDEASAALSACVMTSGATEDTERLKQEISDSRAAFKRAQREQFGKLFS